MNCNVKHVKVLASRVIGSFHSNHSASFSSYIFFTICTYILMHMEEELKHSPLPHQNLIVYVLWKNRLGPARDWHGVCQKWESRLWTANLTLQAKAGPARHSWVPHEQVKKWWWDFWWQLGVQKTDCLTARLSFASVMDLGICRGSFKDIQAGAMCMLEWPDWVKKQQWEYEAAQRKVIACA